MLQRQSVLQMQFIGELMKAHYISYFTDGFWNNFWNLVKSLGVTLTVSMKNGWRPFFNINSVPPITYWWIWMPLQEGKISIGTHTRCGATMINTSWHAKIDAQKLFYFMILPFGGTIIDLAVSKKAKLELSTDAHGTLIFDNYDECSPKNYERTHRAEVGYHWLQHETTDVTASPWNDHENKTKWELLYPVAAWMNELLYKGRLTASTYSTKLTPRLTLRWWMGWGWGWGWRGRGWWGWDGDGGWWGGGWVQFACKNFIAGLYQL